jgi:hypothetical protein
VERTQQQIDKRGASSAQYAKASRALAGVQPTAPRAEWPESMERELMACRTAADHRLWAERWALHLGGQVLSENAPVRPVGGGGRIMGGAREPS